MQKLKVLIVDDNIDNRLVLYSICKKFDDFSIRQADDGQEAVEIVQEWGADIVLMDVLMPRLDGYEASKIIKQDHEDITIMVVSAVLDDALLERFSDIGVEIYIHKPIDKALIRFKLLSIAANIRLKRGESMSLSAKASHNLFTSDIRSYKTVFHVNSAEAMMDFGVWLLDVYSHKDTHDVRMLDNVLEIFYRLMRMGTKNSRAIHIVVEESFEEYFFTMVLPSKLVLNQALIEVTQNMQIVLKQEDKVVSIRLIKALEQKQKTPTPSQEIKISQTGAKVQSAQTQNQKSKKTINENEKTFLKQSFKNKTSAAEYVSDIGGDVFDEIMDLQSIDTEYEDQMHILQVASSVQLFEHFCETVLMGYARAINNLFEFAALSYALSSLSLFIKESAYELVNNKEKLNTLVPLLEDLLLDLSQWRQHIFIAQDTQDIHYLDSSFFSSCMQIEMLLSNKELVVDGNENDNDMEFF